MCEFFAFQRVEIRHVITQEEKVVQGKIANKIEEDKKRALEEKSNYKTPAEYLNYINKRNIDLVNIAYCCDYCKKEVAPKNQFTIKVQKDKLVHICDECMLLFKKNNIKMDVVKTPK